MQFVSQRIDGIAVLLLWTLLVAVKWAATGSPLKDRPKGGVWIWLTRIFNFLFLLAAVPLAASTMLLGQRAALGPAQGALWAPSLRTGMGIAGLLLYCAGCLLMAWALLTLRGNYQVGGNAPRASDELVTRGPYRFVRHPMYAAALCISLGLACLTQSPAYFSVFCIYVVLILALIPFEEERLHRAYGERYAIYRGATKRLAPLLF
jgi:protein-S-isoprenylcysteine O-methyltransferase Ste14